MVLCLVDSLASMRFHLEISAALIITLFAKNITLNTDFCKTTDKPSLILSHN